MSQLLFCTSCIWCAIDTFPKTMSQLLFCTSCSWCAIDTFPKTMSQLLFCTSCSWCAIDTFPKTMSQLLSSPGCCWTIDALCPVCKWLSDSIKLSIGSLANWFGWWRGAVWRSTLPLIIVKGASAGIGILAIETVDCMLW